MTAQFLQVTSLSSSSCVSLAPIRIQVIRAGFKWQSINLYQIRNYSDKTQQVKNRNQSEFRAITYNLLKAREKWRLQGAIGFVFASHWLKNWREIC